MGGGGEIFAASIQTVSVLYCLNLEHEISLRTFKKHLQGDWEFVFFNKEVDNIQEVFKDHFFEIFTTIPVIFRFPG